MFNKTNNRIRYINLLTSRETDCIMLEVYAAQNKGRSMIDWMALSVVEERTSNPKVIPYGLVVGHALKNAQLASKNK